MKLLLLINIFLYLFSPMAFTAHQLDLLGDAIGSSSLAPDVFENTDADGEQESEIACRRIWLTSGFHHASVDHLAMPLMANPIHVPPQLLS